MNDFTILIYCIVAGLIAGGTIAIVKHAISSR